MRLLILTIISLCISCNVFAKYDRKSFKHWVDSDRNCRNTRAEILIRDNTGNLQFTSPKKCTVKTGEWSDFYTHDKLYLAQNIDIDHIVPLKHAHDIGAEFWSSEMKEAFANDPLNLIVTSKHFNRQKGSKTILEWLPADRNLACKYVKRWFAVKNKYHLSISKEEIATSKLLGNCSNSHNPS